MENNQVEEAEREVRKVSNEILEGVTNGNNIHLRGLAT